ncbi:MAG: hypothetical protein ABI855_01265 [Bacteroidota bacterium]
MINKILSFPETLLRRIMNSGFFATIVSNPISAMFTLVAIVVFFSFPSYDIVLATHEMDVNWTSVFLQAREPFVNHNYLYESGSHSEKLAFRFVPALMLHILHIQTKLPALIFQFFTLVLFYYLLILVFNKLFKDRNKAFIFALPICFVFPGHVYVSDYRGIFDTLALDFLLMALLFRDKVYVIIPLLLAYFSDERALIASPAIFLLNLLEKNSFESIKSMFKGIFFSSNVYFFISWIAYIIIRFWLGKAFGLNSGSGGAPLFFEHLNRTFYAVYVGLEGFIIPFVLIILFLLRNRIYSFTALLIISFLSVLCISLAVIDINRSMSYVILLIVLILALLDKLYSKETAFRIIAWVILINLVHDDSYPFLAQLYRMKFITHTIYNGSVVFQRY